MLYVANELTEVTQALIVHSENRKLEKRDQKGILFSSVKIERYINDFFVKITNHLDINIKIRKAQFNAIYVIFTNKSYKGLVYITV